MSKLSKLRGDSEIFKIQHIEIEIKPLTFKEFTRGMELYEKEKNTEAMEYFIFTTLRKDLTTEGDDGISDEDLKIEIDNLPPRFIVDLMKIIQKVNGLTGDEDTSLSKKE